MPTLVPVEHDPFAPAAGPTPGAPQMVPVEHDPFATAQPAQPADKPITAGGTAAAFARGAAPFAVGGAIGSVVPGIGTTAGVAATALWEFGGSVWNWLGLPHMNTPQEYTDRAFDAVGVQNPGNWVERASEASGSLIASTVGNPPTPRPATPAGPAQQLMQDFDAQQVPPRVTTVGQDRGAALTSNIVRTLPFSGRAVQQAERQDIVATSAATQRNAAALGSAAEPDIAGKRVGDTIRTWVEGLGQQSEATSGRLGAARENYDAGSVGRNALKRYAADTSQAESDYGRFWELMQGAPASGVSNTRAVLAKLMGQFPNAPELEGLFQPSPIARAHSALEPRTVQVPAKTSSMMDPYGRPIVTSQATTIETGGKLSMDEMKTLRSHIGYRLENPQIGPDHIPRAELKRLYAALSQDMEASAGARSPQAAQALKRASGNYATRMTMIDRIEPLITGDRPELTFARLNTAALKGGSADAGLLRAAKASMSPAEWGDIGATVVTRLGEVKAGSKDAFASPNFSPANFAANWGKLSNQAKAELFGPSGPGTTRTALETLAQQAGARQDLVKLVQTDHAESVFTNLNTAAGIGAGANAGLLRQAKGVMSQQDWGDFGASVVARLGRPTPGAKDVLAEVDFSPSSFGTNWAKLSDRAKDIIFGPDQPGTPRASIEQLARVNQAQKNVGKLQNVARSGEHIIGAGVMIEAWHSLGSVSEMAGFGAGMGAAYTFGKIITDPRTARWWYDNRGGQMMTAGNAGKAGLSLANALSSPHQGPDERASPTPKPMMPAGPGVSSNLGMAPGAGLSPAAPF